MRRTADHAWYFTWFIVVAVALPKLGWSARLIGLSTFTYFWLLQVNATQGVWRLGPLLTACFWLPFILPALGGALRCRFQP